MEVGSDFGSATFLHPWRAGLSPFFKMRVWICLFFGCWRWGLFFFSLVRVFPLGLAVYVLRDIPKRRQTKKEREGVARDFHYVMDEREEGLLCLPNDDRG